jgi:hypothetical protein
MSLYFETGYNSLVPLYTTVGSSLSGQYSYVGNLRLVSRRARFNPYAVIQTLSAGQ